MASQMMSLLLAAVVVTQVAGLLWLFGGRALLLDALMLDHFGPEVAASIAVLERLPPEERSEWLPRLSRPSYTYRLDAADLPPGAPSWLGERIGGVLRHSLGPAYSTQVRAADSPLSGAEVLDIQTRLKDGTALHISLLPLSAAPPGWVYGVLLAQLGVVLATAWWAVRRVTRSLAVLAGAAQAADLRQAEAGPQANGPLEVRQLAAAYEGMQQRVAAHNAERTRLLAAIAHDLQTPITRMKLRAELHGDALQRDKTLRDLDEMQTLVEQGIDYARAAHAVQEPSRRFELGSLLDSLVCDATDAGQDVSLESTATVTLDSKPLALRRLVANLLGNALKFAGRAELSVRLDQNVVRIAVTDRGPGIPEPLIGAVKAPFYRVEGSRSRDTGGAGLGLAIADELARSLGGTLELRNREGGGLAATLTLPAITS